MFLFLLASSHILPSKLKYIQPNLQKKPSIGVLIKRCSGNMEICSKFTGEDPCQSAISINLQNNFIEITLRHGCSPVNLLHIFRTPFYNYTYGGLLLNLRRMRKRANHFYGFCQKFCGLKVKQMNFQC